MSKLSDVFAISQKLSLVAGEEAARTGRPQVDLEHVLLGLLLSDGRAGEVLRAAGLTVDGTRAALETVHAEQLAALGVVAAPLPARPLLDPAIAGGLDWTPRANALLQSSAEWSTDLPLLRAVLDEPSGFVRRTLARAGVDEAQLRAAVDEADRAVRVPAAPPPPDPEWHHVTHTGFVPAAPAQVWALVSDPARRPAWDGLVVAVERVDATSWRLTAAPEAPARRRSRRSEPQHGSLREVAIDPGRSVEWETSWPQERRPPVVHRLRVTVSPTTGGSRVELVMGVRRGTGLNRLQRALRMRLQTYFLRQSLVSRAGGISRVFR